VDAANHVGQQLRVEVKKMPFGDARRRTQWRRHGEYLSVPDSSSWQCISTCHGVSVRSGNQPEDVRTILFNDAGPNPLHSQQLLFIPGRDPRDT